MLKFHGILKILFFPSGYEFLRYTHSSCYYFMYFVATDIYDLKCISPLLSAWIFGGILLLYCIQINTLKVSGLRTSHQSTAVPCLQYFLNIWYALIKFTALIQIPLLFCLFFFCYFAKLISLSNREKSTSLNQKMPTTYASLTFLLLIETESQLLFLKALKEF